MFNRLQKALWIISISVPIWIGFAISWCITYKTSQVSIIAIAIAIFITIAFVLSYSYGVKNLSKINISVSKVTPNDRPIIVFIISYILPFASIAFDAYNPVMFSGIAALVYLAMINSNSIPANPLMFAVGFHFYDIESENGIGNYLLMTRKIIRNKDEINVVNRVTEYFLIMREDKNV